MRDLEIKESWAKPEPSAIPRDKAKTVTRGAARQEIAWSHSAFPQHTSARDRRVMRQLPHPSASSAGPLT